MSDTSSQRLRPIDLRRSWLFLPGAEREVLLAAPESGADVLIQELEDFTPPERRAEARALAPEVLRAWKAAGRIAAVRVNPLEADGRDDLSAVMAGEPDIVMLPKVTTPAQVIALDNEISRFETERDAGTRKTEIVPNIETAAGLVRTLGIAEASPRITALLVASEDLAADLGAERAPDGIELAYPRSKFLVDCTAAGKLAIDCPYNWEDTAGLVAEAEYARRLGYVAKSLVAPEHASHINAVFTPDRAGASRAQRLVQAFEAARAKGEARALLDGDLVEVPGYLNAKRLLARAKAFGVI